MTGTVIPSAVAVAVMWFGRFSGTVFDKLRKHKENQQNAAGADDQNGLEQTRQEIAGAAGRFALIDDSLFGVGRRLVCPFGGERQVCFLGCRCPPEFAVFLIVLQSLPLCDFDQSGVVHNIPKLFQLFRCKSTFGGFQQQIDGGLVAAVDQINDLFRRKDDAVGECFLQKPGGILLLKVRFCNLRNLIGRSEGCQRSDPLDLGTLLPVIEPLIKSFPVQTDPSFR
jgi:hypothetical protein